MSDPEKLQIITSLLIFHENQFTLAKHCWVFKTCSGCSQIWEVKRWRAKILKAKRVKVKSLLKLCKFNHKSLYSSTGKPIKNGRGNREMFDKLLTLFYIKELIKYEIILAKICLGERDCMLLTGKMRSIVRSFTLKINIQEF